MVSISNVCAQAFDVSRRRRFDIAGAQVRETILVAILDVVVFEAGVLDRLEEVDGLRRASVSC